MNSTGKKEKEKETSKQRKTKKKKFTAALVSLHGHHTL